MSTKFYWSLWAALGVVTIGMFVTGNLTSLSISVVGFVSTLFIFMGMMCVTPALVRPHAPAVKHESPTIAADERHRRSVTAPLAQLPTLAKF
jgi:hypothetical protein